MSAIIQGRLEASEVQEQLLREHSNSVDVLVCSPPYYLKDGATMDLAVAMGRAMTSILKPGARAFVVFGQVAEDFTRPYTFAQDILTEGLLRQEQTLFWVKSISIDDAPVRGHQTPLQGENMVNDGVEFIFQYSRVPRKKANPLDRLAVGVEFADPSNLTRGTRGKNGNKRCRGSALFIPYPTKGKTEKKEHRHEYPEALVEYLIKLAGVREGKVCDLFVGGGTTQRVAERLGLDFVGVQWENDPRGTL